MMAVAPPPRPQAQAQGLRIRRYYTRPNQDVYARFTYEKRSSVLKDAKGKTPFEQHDVEVPTSWSQVATDILAQKYFRRAGVPLPDGETGGESSLKQVVHRMAATWQHWGQQAGYFASAADGQAFYDEVAYMLLAQQAAPNSPQWFNTGLHQAYGIKGKPQGHYYVDPNTQLVKESTSAYERPQPHACFILSVNDDLVNPGGIMDLWVREARIFKYGSGVGTNYANLRAEGEPLSGGGTSSGVMSFLQIGDRAAGAIKSGGTTRRAAKMVVLDIDHPEVEAFIRWKAEEERKVAALVAAGYSNSFEGEAYRTVSGQNSNNSVRVSDAFLEAVQQDADWELNARTTGKPVKTVKARALWNELAQAAWTSADPGVQFADTINRWHTCPADGPIRASNPCAEYLFLDDTACNLASLNIWAFFDAERGELDVPGFRHAAHLWTIVLDISVQMAQYPAKRIAERSWAYRTLGLGFTNLGATLMRLGLPYDSPTGRTLAAGLAGLLTGEAWRTSALLAQQLEPFPAYARNAPYVQAVVREHALAAERLCSGQALAPDHPMTTPIPEVLPTSWQRALQEVWQEAQELGRRAGFRNAQVSVVAPTGTISLLMDADTTGIEPDYSLMKFKKLAGGGYFNLVNQSVQPALQRLGYTAVQQARILSFLETHQQLAGAPELAPEHLPVFDTAQPSQPQGRFISSFGHLHLMAMVQPFVSGAISKTINLPHEATWQDIQEVYWKGWELGLKALSVYRDGSKLSQPLSSSSQQQEAAAPAMPSPQNTPTKCGTCGGSLQQTGACFVCLNCGETTSCG